MLAGLLIGWLGMLGASQALVMAGIGLAAALLIGALLRSNASSASAEATLKRPTAGGGWPPGHLGSFGRCAARARWAGPCGGCSFPVRCPGSGW